MRTETQQFHTGSTEVVLDITRECERFAAAGPDGLLHLFVPHATAGIAIIETGAAATTTCSLPSATCCPPMTGGSTRTEAVGTAGHM